MSLQTSPSVSITLGATDSNNINDWIDYIVILLKRSLTFCYSQPFGSLLPKLVIDGVRKIYISAV